MLRLCSCSMFLTRMTSQQVVKQASRPASSGHAGGGGGVVKFVGGALLASSLGVGGTMAYAGIDDEFRVVLEDNFPGADVVMEMVLGKRTLAEKVTEVPSKLKITTAVLDDKREDKPAVPHPTPKVLPPPPPPVPDVPVLEVPTAEEVPPLQVVSEAPPQVEPVTATEVSNEIVKAVEAAVVEETKDEETKVKSLPEHSTPVNLTPDIENTSLETVLVELCKEMKEMVEGAVTGYKMATDTVTNHMNIMQEVLETNLTGKDEAAWNKMFEAAVAKSDATKCAEIKEREAVAAIENVIEMIAAGRKNKSTANNLELMVAEESATRAIGMLEQAKAQGATMRGELKVMEEYRDLVEAGREQFHKEMASIMPDVQLGEMNGKLNEDELNMFITHAYKKVLHLQQELARQQTLEQERFKKALEKQRVDIQLGESDKMEQELAKQGKELVVEHEARMNIIKEEVERDMRSQLRRQAAAHSDHLQDMLSVQEAELKRKLEHQLSEELANSKSSHLEGLSSLSGMVSGLSTSLQARVEQDQRAVTAQQLWIACSGLDAAMDTMKPLMGEVVMVKTAAAPGDDFVQVVLSSLSPLALDRGVYSINNLKERFCRVEKVARRVAGVGEEGGSLLSYGLSYLQSVLMVDLSVRSPGELEDKVNLSELSQSDLLIMAKHSLERNNLARAVQYMTLLKGETSRVVSDWLSEARLTMETKQAAEALLAHAVVEGGNSLL